MKPSTLDGQTWLLSPNCSSLETGLYNNNHTNHQNGYLVSSILSSSPSTLSPTTSSSSSSSSYSTSGSTSIKTATVPVTKSETLLKSISKTNFIIRSSASSSLSTSPPSCELNNLTSHNHNQSPHYRQLGNHSACLVTHSLPSFCWCKPNGQTLTGGGCCADVHHDHHPKSASSSGKFNTLSKNDFNCILTATHCRSEEHKKSTFCSRNQQQESSVNSTITTTPTPTTSATIATSIQSSFSYVNQNDNHGGDSDNKIVSFSSDDADDDTSYLIATNVDTPTLRSIDCPILLSTDDGGSSVALNLTNICETIGETTNEKVNYQHIISQQQPQQQDQQNICNKPANNNSNNGWYHNFGLSAQENQCLPWHRSDCLVSSDSSEQGEEEEEESSLVVNDSSSSPCCDANFNHSNYKQANHDGDKDEDDDDEDRDDNDEKKKKGDDESNSLIIDAGHPNQN